MAKTKVKARVAKQPWLVVAPELAQSQEFHASLSSGNTPMSNLAPAKIFAPNHFDIFGLLARPSPSSTPTMAGHDLIQSSHVSPAPSTLERLPFDIKFLILECLDSQPSDIIALGLSSSSLWQTVTGHIHRSYARSTAPWSGKSLALIDPNCRTLPDCFIDSTPNESDPEESPASESQQQLIRQLTSKELRKEAVTPHTMGNIWSTALQNCLGESRIPQKYWSIMTQQVQNEYMFPKNSEWLLRNHNTKEYVSSNSLDQSTGESTREMGVRLNPLELAHILLINISWQQSDPNKLFQPESTCGPWTGHRFDLVTRETHNAGKSAVMWTDVSTKMVREAREAQSEMYRMLIEFREKCTENDCAILAKSVDGSIQSMVSDYKIEDGQSS